MEIILKEDFKGLGYKNEIVSVKPGYARNYLIPQGFAWVANEPNKKIAQENVRQMAHKIAKRKQDAEAIATRLRQLTIQVKAKAGEKGKIFGAITPLQLADAIKGQTGYLADRRDISFEKPAKHVGMHKANVKLHKDVAITLQFEVVAEA